MTLGAGVTLVLARPTPTLPATVLQRDAGAFAGWPLFEPETEARAAARRGIPRPPSDLRGAVLESWWDGEREAVLGRVAVVDGLASLLGRLKTAIRLEPHLSAGSRRVLKGGRRLVESIAPDPESGWLAVVTGTGGSGSAHLALVECYTDNNGEKSDMSKMTLAEALRRPEVVDHLRVELGLAEPRTAPAAREPERTTSARLLESMMRPVEAPPTESPFVAMCKRRGLNPAHFGMGGGAA
ncbi:hypothetical protein DSM104299_04244 [Baekduia alba]|uniref:hypothetical protein n=1 Tax=Baekduia alba TaxID=2997333 RepID=UPI0023418051|nr:hypothetical protein [Baekduia alba]WCB95496.1 hypothetical protein DSM104299_04244 [Baekduia alba]